MSVISINPLGTEAGISGKNRVSNIAADALSPGNQRP